MNAPKPNVRIINYRPPPTLNRFMVSNAFVRGVCGPVGCVRGDTLIATESGWRAIETLQRPVRVLSWNSSTGRFQLSLSGGAFLKGKDCLYRVITQHGEFVASGNHLVSCGDGEYQRVDTLAPGQYVFRCSDNLEVSSEVFSLSMSKQDAPYYSQTVVDCLGDYSKLARLCGRQLLQGGDTVAVSPPLRDDAHRQIQSFCPGDILRLGDQGEYLQEHNHPCQSFDRTQTDDFSFPVLHHPDDGGDYNGAGLSCTHSGTSLQVLQLPLSTVHHPRISSKAHNDHPLSTSYSTVISVERELVKDFFWDMQVLDTNNYVTKGGIIHHNSGKSVACCMEVMRRMRTMAKCSDGLRKSKWIVIRNTLPQLETTTIATWVDWFPEASYGRISRKPPYTQKIRFDDVDSEVIFLALDKPDDVKKVLSLECTGAWINEAREIPKEILDALTGRVGRFPSIKDKPSDYEGDFPSWSGILMDTNPPTDDHWWYHLAEEKTPQDFEFFRQPSGESREAENVENLPPGYYRRLKQGKSQEWVDVYVHGLYGSIEEGQPVYGKNFTRSTHVTRERVELPPNQMLYGGLDFGLTPCAVIAWRDMFSRWYALYEYTTSDMTIEMFAQLIKQELKIHFDGHQIKWYGDPAGGFRNPNDGKTAFDIMKQHLGMVEAAPGGNRFEPRKECVLRCLTQSIQGQPRLMVDPKCKMLVRGFEGGYRYKRIQVSGEAKYALEPEKNKYSHIHDALQYCLAGGGEYRDMMTGGERKQGRTIKMKSWKSR